ncbi:Phycobilisome degradation protein nblA [Cyanobacterium stanieri PCC 7202]|uniref:Phycobilisome degradation protein nblA n=1 Tax=Cyanobacterium stanieri (strain ATCC 29140 / PCC 7202) TaxID=292563 RepID=K9YMU7_CYASC|nr:Phycobilisome degradation protein nblA [Cyanobacterium stanieri PCC 7202]
MRSEVIMQPPANLSLEQQFKLEVLKEQVKTLSQEQAQNYLIEVFRQMMVKDNLVKHLMKDA